MYPVRPVPRYIGVLPNRTFVKGEQMTSDLVNTEV